jgi:hypothetical protein
VADIEMDIIKPVALDFSVVGAQYRAGELGTFVIIGRNIGARSSEFQDTALTGPRLGNQEVLTSRL